MLPERGPGQRATALRARAASLDALGVFLWTGGEGKIIYEKSPHGDRQPSQANRPGRRARKDKTAEGKLCGDTREKLVCSAAERRL